MAKQPNICAMTVNDKIQYVENLIIYDPKFTDLAKNIEECRTRSKLSSEPRCLLITGITGSGKTTLGEHIMNKYPRYFESEGTIVPVLMTKLFAPATVKNMATALLLGIGDPLPDKGTKTNQTLRLYKFIKECRVELIIIDEFQHLIDRKSNRVMVDASDWLKDLVNQSKVPIVLLAMPWGKHILDMNSQLERRFSAQKELTPFGWATPDDKGYTIRFLSTIDAKLPFEKRSELGSEDVAFRIMCASRGKRSEVMLLVRRAAEYSIKLGLDRITVDTLAKAYDTELASIKRPINPFRVHINNLKYRQITHNDNEYKMPLRENKEKPSIDF